MVSKQNDHHFVHEIVEIIFLNHNYGIFTHISLKYVHRSPINKKQVLVKIMADDKPNHWW